MESFGMFILAFLLGSLAIALFRVAFAVAFADRNIPTRKGIIFNRRKNRIEPREHISNHEVDRIL